jgi:hypothetical protein
VRLLDPQFGQLATAAAASGQNDTTNNEDSSEMPLHSEGEQGQVVS